MGTGIGPEALEAALKAGAEARRAELELEVVTSSASAHGPEAAAEAVRIPSAPREVLTPLFEKPDGWSKVLAQLPPDAQVTIVATEGNFVRVRTGDGVPGYVSRSAPLAALAATGRSPGGLY
jgi:predicted RNA-binding protein with EMAP domain